MQDHILVRIFISLLFFVLAVQMGLAQQSTFIEEGNGTVVYHTKVNMLYPTTQYDTLRFNRTKSIFTWNLNAISPSRVTEKTKSVPVAGNISMQPEIYYGLRVNVLNTFKDSLYSLVGMPNISKLLYVKEQIPQIDWSIKDSTKYIGNYRVKKATAFFRGRYYTAWFTLNIPVHYGPWKLHGLPGLILQAYDRSGNIYFSATDIEIKDNRAIGAIQLDNKKVQKVTLAEYKELIDNFDRYQKQSLLKIIRPYVSDEELADMNIRIKPVKHMERFGKNEQ